LLLRVVLLLGGVIFLLLCSICSLIICCLFYFLILFLFSYSCIEIRRDYQMNVTVRRKKLFTRLEGTFSPANWGIVAVLFTCPTINAFLVTLVYVARA
jgi:hypothetical protein